MKLKNFKKAMVIVDILVIIALMVIMLTTNSFTQMFSLATAEKVNAGAENMSFNFVVSPEETKTKAGETATLIVSVADISAGENGINSIVGFLEYDEALFESVEVQGIAAGTEDYNTTTDWNIELNKIQGHELYGKFCIYTIQESVTEDQDVVKITMKLKSDLAPQITEVNFTDLVSSDGDFEIADEDRTAVIIIEAEDDDNQGSEGDGSQGSEGDGNQGTEGDGSQGSEDDGNQGTEGDGNQGSEGDDNQGSQGDQNQGSQGNQGNQSTTKPSSPQTGDTKILMVIAILILLIIANLLIFCKKLKTKIIAAVVTIIVGILSFVIVSNAQNTQNTTQPLTINDKINNISFQEKILNTDKVLVKDSTISAVTPEMTVEDFLNIFNNQIKVTDNGTQVTSGELKTGMKVSLLNPTSTDIDKDTIYEVVVAGDINKDGISNQIELTKIIRNTINNQKWQLNDIEKLAADMNIDGKIDNKDVEASVNYIVYGDSFEYTETVQEDIRNVDAPTIEIVQGDFNEEVNCYINNVIIRITETDKNASKTRYKIEDENGNFVTLDELANNSSGNNSSTQYTGLAKFVEMERTNKDENGNVIKQITIKKDGIYKISALTDGELGNRSDITYKVIVKGKSDKKYTVTYDYATNGGASSADSQITTENIDVIYNTPVDLSKQGTKQYYKFIGWNTDKDATTALSTLTMGTQDVTLYAIYEKDITIALDKTSISMEYGSTQTINATTKNTGNIVWSSSDESIATVSSTGVVTAKKVGTVTITATATTDSTVTATCAVTVTPKTLTISAQADNKEYDGTTNVVNGQIIVNGILNAEDVHVAGNFAYETATAGTAKKVNVTNITLSGADANNYKINETSLTTTSDITKVELTATYVSETITYGETPDVKVTVTGFVNGETEDGQTMADGYVKPIVANSNTAVGTYTLTPQDGQATNYTFKYVPGTLEILNKELTSNDVTISLDQDTFTYTGTAIEPTVIIKDGNKNLIEGTDFTVTYTDNTNAGTATIIIDGAGNYSTQIIKTFKINKVKLTPTATVNSKVYDGTTTATGTITLSEAVNNENPTVSVLSIFTFDNATVGTNKTVTVSNIELEDVWKTNYELTQDTLILTNGEITKAELTATYIGENITYGDTPALNIHVDGFVNGEDETTAAGYVAPTVVITDKDGNIVNVQDLVVSGSPYTVTPKDGDATNYKFKYEDGVLVVNENPAIVTITLNPDSFVYDGTAKQPAITVTDIATGKVLTANTDYTFGYVDNINAGTGIVNITLIGNYTGIATETFDILQADGIASVTIQGWIYGEPSNNPVPSSSTNGTDNVTYLYTGTTNAGVAYSDSVAPTEAGNYKVTATFAQTQNYKEVKAEDDFTISKAQVAEPAVNTGLVYTGLSQTGVTSGSNYSLSGTAIATNAGDYTATATLSNTDNYEWTDGTTAPKTYNWSIAKVQLTPSAVANNKVYDGNTTATGTITFAEAVNNEKPTATTATYIFENATVGKNKVVTVTNIVLDSQWTTNYALVATQTQTTADITAAKLTATYVSEEINYGETPDLIVEVTGFVNGETKETAEGFTMPVVINKNTEPGEYELTPTGGSAINYTFDYVKGTLKINLPIYTITYELNGGELEQGKENPDEYTQKSDNITLNNPTKEGYEFLGWTLTKLDGVVQNASTPSTSVTIAKGSKGNREYTANWNLVAPTVQVTAENLDVNLFEDETTTFTATVSNASNPSYQWYYGENAINGATASTYSISTKDMNASNYKGGEYSVKVTNNEPATTLAETGASTTTTTSEKLTQTVKYNEVSTAEQMNNLRIRVNNQAITFEGDTITQTTNIDLSTVCGPNVGNWTAIGTTETDSIDTNMFKGTFDGNNKEITNLYINQDEGMLGLFGIAKDSTIKNVTVSGSITGTGVTYRTVAGGIVARNLSGTIDSCTNNVNIVAISRAGGIAGKSEGDSIITNCINNGSITSDVTKTTVESGETICASKWIGGIAGIGQGIISNCTNNATGVIKANQAGGIAGICNNGQTNILNCTNHAELIGNQVGGITYFFKGADQNYKISNCVNTGNITVQYPSTESSLYAAGISCAINGVIENSHNDGNITTISETGNLGTVVGGIYATENVETVIRKCYNTGDITSHSAHTGTSDKAMSAAGGIAGYMTHNTIIDNTYNTGNITATKAYGTNTNSAGGIVGYVRILEDAEVATTENDSANDEESGENTTTIVKEIVAPFITNSYSTGLISATHNSHSNYNFNGGVIGQYSAETTSITDIVENTYYLNTSSVKGIDNTQEDITNIAIAKTSDYMKTLQFVKDLGQDNWELPASDAVNYGYPIFGSETIYEITYDLAGGQLEEGKTNPTLYVSDNSNITLNNPIRAGYAFSGWTGTDLTKATENVVIPTGSTGDRTYTATWELLAPTVSVTVENAEVNLFDDFVTTFTANVEESADVTYQWYYNGSAIEGANKKSYGIATTAMNSAETDYSIINSTNYLGGEYSVVVTNSAGQASAAKTQTITRTIGTPEQMKNFNVRVEEQEIYFNGVEVEQVADIDLSSVCNSTVGTWDPIGLYDIQNVDGTQVTIVKPFSGTYKGNNYEVTGLYIDTVCDEIRLGLFGYVNGGTINDLTVKGEIKTKTGTSIAAGGIVGYIYNGKVNNCINYAKIDGYRVGGIVGLNGNGTELNNCINYGTITGNYIGGITYGNVGSIYSSVNNGIVSATSNVEEQAVYAGGITYYNNGLIERTYNNNTVTAVGEAKNSGVVAGGIYALDNHNSVVRKSYNKAAVTADCGHDGTLTGAMCAAGGIAGYMRCNTFIENCYNTGDITAKKLQGSNTNSAGGIVGFIQFIEQEETDVIVNTYSTPLVKNCYSVGSITAEHVTQYNAKGGVIGQYRSSSREITDIVTNTYYLNTTADKGIDYAVDTTAIATPKDSAFMKTDEFVTLLGAENWQIVANENDNYPVLNWQYETFAISYDLAGGELPEGVTNPTNYAESSLDIKLNNPVKDYYVFTGWTGTDLTEPTLDVTIPSGSTGNRTYTANWTDAYYYNETSDAYYVTLADAVSNSPTGSQINVIKNANETKRATVASSKELTLNLNNFTVSYTGTEDVFRLYNEGTLNLIGSGKITSTEGYTLRNAGIMNIRLEDDGIVESIGNEIIDRAIQNSGTGTLNIYSGTIQTDAADNMPENAQTYAVIGNAGTTINMYGGKIDAIATHPNQSGIFSEGNVNINGGTITANLRGITMKAAGNLNITKGSISSLINGNTIFFASTGKLSITGTEEVIINSNNVKGIYNSAEDGGNGTIIVNNQNATISGNDGIYMETGNVDVIAGTVIGKLHYGILSESEATITIGKDDTTVTQDTPIITGITYGINRSTGDLNFYDGLIKGATAAFSGEVADKPDDYVVSYRTEDNIQIAYLDKSEYTVTYNLDGGIVSGTNPETYSIYSEDITLINPTKTGYVFEGWIGSNGSTPELTVTIPKGSTGDKEYTAIWTRLAASVNDGTTITYYKSLQEAVTTAETVTGSTVTLLKDVTEDITISTDCKGTLNIDLNEYTVTGTGNSNQTFSINTITEANSELINVNISNGNIIATTGNAIATTGDVGGQTLTITDVNITTEEGYILLEDGFRTYFEDCTLISNSTTIDYAILSTNYTLYMDNCTLTSKTGGISYSTNTGIHLTDTTISANDIAIIVRGAICELINTQVTSENDYAIVDSTGNQVRIYGTSKVVSKASSAIYATVSGTIYIGQSTSEFSITEPCVQGATYAVEYAESIKDNETLVINHGILKGKTSAANTTILVGRNGYCLVEGEETIDGSKYQTAYLRELEMYTISYNAKGGTGAPESQSKQEGTDATLSIEVPVKEDNIFLGWDTDSTATTVVYQPGEVYVDEESVELYAVWHQTYIELKSIGNMGWSVNEATGSIRAAGGVATLKVLGAKYTFSVTASSSGISITTKDANGNSIETKSATTGTLVLETTSETAEVVINGYGTINVTLVDGSVCRVVKNLKEVTVTFYMNDGTNDIYYTKTTTQFAELIGLPSTNPTREGYLFLGWSQSSTNSTGLVSGVGYIGEDKTYYAIWQQDYIEVISLANAGWQINETTGSITAGAGTSTFNVVGAKYTFTMSTSGGITITGKDSEGNVTVSQTLAPGSSETATLVTTWDTTEVTINGYGTVKVTLADGSVCRVVK